ncbi:MAG: cupin domain-containing protein [Bacteroidota bacterium]
MPDAPSLFGDLSVTDFLQTYWQKQPLLVRQAFPGWTSPVTPDDLLDLACDEEASSRLILEEGGEYPWQAFYGPFEPEELASLPATHWTVLVQEVDRFVPEVAALLERFRFIPNWRIDDVMISYAPTQGGVGAHIDQYDVFLIQGQGHRRWQIDTTPVEEEQLIPDLDVRILADFEPDAEWVLGPGDMLYLPPRIAHYGVAEDPCLTYSVGFRAPSALELADGFVGHLTQTLAHDPRYGDPDLTPPPAPGLISAETLATVRTMLQDLVADEERLATWFGGFVTEPKRLLPTAADAPAEAVHLRAALRDGARLHRTAVAYLAYQTHPDGSATLFALGEAYALSAALAFAAPLLTGTTPLDHAHLAAHLDREDVVDLLLTLTEAGALTLLA